MILVTGGAGFIGSNFLLDWFEHSEEPVVNLDCLTYAGDLKNLAGLDGDPRHRFVQGDICDRALVDRLLREQLPRAVVHFAAESSVDRSIRSSRDFLRTNVEGTRTLLEAAHGYLRDGGCGPNLFRFLHISTDEVFGSLTTSAPAFNESSPYAPNNPYAASKAASDHLVRAWHETFALPVLTINCSNNFGPHQNREKLVPATIANALEGKPLSLYGDGLHVRDWLYVSDHCAAIRAVLERGRIGATYLVGGRSERTNLQVVTAICDLLDEVAPDPGGSYRGLIAFAADRAGHDRRYAVDPSRIESELSWRRVETFESGLRKTVRWYLDQRGRRGTTGPVVSNGLG